MYSWSFSPLTNGPWHYRKSVFETPRRHWGFHFPKHWKFTPSPQISYHCWKNLAVPEDSWSLCPSDLWSVVSTMKVVSKGHLAKNRCREGSSTFVHMSLAGVHPREAKTTRIPSPSWSASLHPSGWDHLCLSGNYRALHLMYGNVQAKTWFRGIGDVQHPWFLFLTTVYLLLHHETSGKQPRACNSGNSKWGGRGKKSRGIQAYL